jgi:hypothetical protein
MYKLNDMVMTAVNPHSSYTHKVQQIAGPMQRMNQGVRILEEDEDHPGFWWVTIPSVLGRRELYHEHEMRPFDDAAAEARAKFLHTRWHAKKTNYAAESFRNAPISVHDEVSFPVQSDSADALKMAMMAMGKLSKGVPIAAGPPRLAAYAAEDTMRSSGMGMMGFLEKPRGDRTRSFKGSPFQKGRTPVNYEDAFAMAQEELQRREKAVPSIAINTQGGRPAIKAQMDAMKGKHYTSTGTGLGAGADPLRRPSGATVRRHQLPKGADVYRDKVPMGTELKQLEARLGTLLDRHAASGAVPEVRVSEDTTRQVSRAIRKYVADMGDKLADSAREGLLKLSVAFEMAPLFQVGSGG